MAEPSPISFACGSCGKPLRVAAADGGKRVRCKACGALTVAPLSLDDVPPAPARKPPPRPLPPKPKPVAARPLPEPPPRQSAAPVALVCPECWKPFTIPGPTPAEPVPCPAAGCRGLANPQVGVEAFAEEPPALPAGEPEPSWRTPSEPDGEPDVPAPQTISAEALRPLVEQLEFEDRIGHYHRLLTRARVAGLVFLGSLGVVFALYPTVPEVTRGPGTRSVTWPGPLPFILPWAGAVVALLVGYYAVHRGSTWRAAADPDYRKWLRRGAAAVTGVVIVGAATYLPWQKCELVRLRMQADHQLLQLWLLQELHEDTARSARFRAGPPVGPKDGPPGGPLDIPPQVTPKPPDLPAVPSLEDLLALDRSGAASLRVDPVTGGPLTYHPRRAYDDSSAEANGRASRVVAYYPPASDGIQVVLLSDGDRRYVPEQAVSKTEHPVVDWDAVPAYLGRPFDRLWGKVSGKFFGLIALGAVLVFGPPLVMGVLGWYVPGRFPTSPLRAPAQVVAALIAGVYGLVGLFAALLLFGAALDGAATGGPAGPALGGLLVGAFAVAMIVVAVRLGRSASVGR